jgi:hypothetical protein
MDAKVKNGGKMDVEEPQSGKMGKSTTIRSMMKRLKPRRGEIIIYFCVILLLLAGTIWRNRIWNREIELWADCVKKSPNKARPPNNLGVVLIEQGRYP